MSPEAKRKLWIIGAVVVVGSGLLVWAKAAANAQKAEDAATVAEDLYKLRTS